MFSSSFQIKNGARFPLCIFTTATTAISFKSYFWFPSPDSDFKVQTKPSFSLHYYISPLFPRLCGIEKACIRPVRFPAPLYLFLTNFKMPVICMHSELHSKHLLLKGTVHSPTSCNLLLEYIISPHFLYTQKSVFEIQLHCNFFSSSDFSYPIFLL